MASITFDPTSIPLAIPPTIAVVARYGGGAFSLLPNVQVVSVALASGANPGSAHFRYALSVLNPPGFPARIEDVLGLDRGGPYVVQQDDRLCVLAVGPAGYSVLFDGFAQLPQGDLSPSSEDATFVAVGVASRCWDTPLGGAVMRNGPDPTVVDDVGTHRPARFNPDGGFNRTPAGAWAGTIPDRYPTFLDVAPRSDGVRAKWSIADAARYILAVGNDGAYVQSPALDTLPSLLCDRAGADPATQTPKDIPAHDLDVTGEPWPDALVKLLSPHNVGLYFRTGQDGAGLPKTTLSFFRTDDADNTSPKSVPLQAPGQPLIPALSITNALGVVRDGSKIANAIAVDTQCTRHEVGIVLAPGFTPAAADVANKLDYDLDSPTFVPANINKYRVYVANEAGDGYFDFPTSSFKTTPACNLDPVFGKPQVEGPDGIAVPQYARRRRPGIGTLFSLDNTKERFRARLYISSDYNQPIPGVWDRSGTWCEVGSGMWELLPDRLGVRITTPRISDLDFAKNPVPGFGTTTPVNNGGKLSLVESQNATLPPSNAQHPRVVFLLVCVIESDRGLGSAAARRPASVSPYQITRRVDARDRFVRNIVSASSILNATSLDTTDATLGGRDDATDATSYAEGVRAACENASFDGTIAIPWISGAYQIGDKIGNIPGRNISLRTNGGAGQGEAAQYPVVMGVTWQFLPTQATTLHLSDLKKEAAPPPEHQS